MKTMHVMGLTSALALATFSVVAPPEAHTKDLTPMQLAASPNAAGAAATGDAGVPDHRGSGTGTDVMGHPSGATGGDTGGRGMGSGGGSGGGAAGGGSMGGSGGTGAGGGGR